MAQVMDELPKIPAVDPGMAERLHGQLDALAKPPGSLGRLEALASRIGQIQNTAKPRLDRVQALIFAGDHGLNEEGVSAYPSSVTAAMVSLFLTGRAGVNALARAAEVELAVIDAGIAADLGDAPGLIHAKLCSGTRNAAREPALSSALVDRGLLRGAEIACAAIEKGVDAVILGEMGIGNTAAAALIMHRLLPAPLAACIGAGAGHDEAGLARKQAAIERAAARSAASDPLTVLAEFGGAEIVMMAGAAIGTASRRKVVVVDGFISSAAVLAAIRLVPDLADYCVFAHCSAERGHRIMLNALGVEPLLDLGLRLGEGTGGVLAAPILRGAARLLSDVATLAEVLG